MRFLRRLIRRLKWRLEWLRDAWPTWEESLEPERRRWWAFRRMVKDWSAERDWRRLWLSLPVLLTGVLWLVVAILLLALTGARTKSQYTAAAEHALASRHYEEACLAFERLLQMDAKPDPAHIFGLASGLQGLGRGEEVATLLASIAPLTAPGYAPAHLVLAQSILGSAGPNPSLAPAAESHLKLALAAEPNNVPAHLLLGALYFQTAQFAAARDHLQKALPTRREAGLLLARVAAAQGDSPGARKFAQDAQSAFKAQALANPGAVLPRVRWAEATLLLGQYAEALDILSPGMEQSGDKLIRGMAAQVCSEWATRVARESPADLGTRLSLIQRGLGYAPNSTELLMQLIDLSHSTGKEADTAGDQLKKLLLAGGRDTAIVHFALGSDAWQRGRLEEARQHFTLAYELAPQMPSVANNMAMMLATRDPPDLPQALAIIQPLADKFPNEPHLLDTRGQILVKMGRWQEGVKCLEVALPSLASKTAAHQALAEAYQHLGLGEFAAEHQRLAVGK